MTPTHTQGKGDLPPRVRLREIVQAGAKLAEVREAEFISESRLRHLSWGRQRAMYLARAVRPDCSLPAIGRAFGGRDHTTVIHAIRRVGERLSLGPDEGDALADLCAVLQDRGAALGTLPQLVEMQAERELLLAGVA